VPATQLEDRRPLWKRGSHVRSRTAPVGVSRRSNGLTTAGRRDHGGDELAAWLAAHPANPRIDELPGGVADPKTSGVFGAYMELPQFTARLTEAINAVPIRRVTYRGTVPCHDRTHSFLAAVLMTPLSASSLA